MRHKPDLAPVFDIEVLTSTSLGGRPGLVRRAVGTVVGVAQLAADGRNHHLLPSGGGVRFSSLAVPLAALRDVARAYRVHVTDVLLSTMAGALSRTLDPRTAPPTVRVQVPITMRDPGTHPDGNVTGAVMIELPLERMSETDRLAAIGRRSRRLYTGTRALGSRFVIGGVCAMLPPPAFSAFARTVYGHRFFQAIMSNVPGPVGAYQLAGAPITAVYPIVPLAPRVPLALGSLSWGPTMFVGVSLDSALADVDRLMAAFRATLDELSSAVPGTSPQRVDERPTGR